VGAIERQRRLPEQLDHLVGRQGAAPREGRAEVFAPEEVHHDERRTRLRVDVGVERLHDVLALDLRRDGRLELEARPQIGVRHEARQHDLERAAPARLPVEDLVHGAHTAGA